jgi:hypothetical protein
MVADVKLSWRRCHTFPVLRRMLLQLLHNVLGGVKGTFESAAWPIASMGQRRNWSTAEDSLLWLGIIRWGTWAWDMLKLHEACAKFRLGAHAARAWQMLCAHLACAHHRLSWRLPVYTLCANSHMC